MTEMHQKNGGGFFLPFFSERCGLNLNIVISPCQCVFFIQALLDDTISCVQKNTPRISLKKNISKFVVMMILDASPEAGRWHRIESIEASH